MYDKSKKQGKYWLSHSIDFGDSTVTLIFLFKYTEREYLLSSASIY